MTFAVVVAEGTSEQVGNSTSHTVAIGSPSAGELVLVWFTSDGNVTITLPGGWTALENDSGTAISAALFYKVAEGTEGANVTVTTSGPEQSAHKYFRLSGFGTALPAESAILRTTGSNPPALTPTGGAKDYLWIALDGRDNNPLNAYTGFPTNYVSTGSLVQASEAAGVSIAWARRELNAASEDPDVFTVDSDNALLATVAIHPLSAPSLSVPTAHNVTQTGVTPRVTTDTANGTLYMVLVPDADVPSVSQIKAGQQSSGAAAIAAANQAVSATGVQSFTAVTGLTSSTAYELYFVHTNSGAQDSAASTVGFSTQAANTPEVTVEPTVSDVTGTAYTIDLGTVTTTGTAYAGLYPDGATPTDAQIKAGTGAIVAGNKATTADTAIGTLVLTNLDSPHDPKVDVKVVYEAATDVFSSIQTISDVFADPPVGKQYIGLGSGPYASWLDSANPAPVNGDVLIWDSVTTPGAFAFVVLASGSFSYDSGGDTSRQTGTRELWRAADQSFSGTQEFAVNNLAPEVPGEGIEFELLENVAFATVDLVAFAVDPEGDTMTGAQSPDDLAAVPPGIAYTDGNMVVTEASLVADQYGNIYRVTDEWGDFGEYSIQFDVIETAQMPDVDDGNVTEEAAITAITGAGLQSPSVSYASSESVTIGNVISQDPAAGTIHLVTAPTAIVVSALILPAKSRPSMHVGGLRLGF